MTEDAANVGLAEAPLLWRSDNAAILQEEIS